MARPKKDIDARAVEEAIAHGNTVEDAAAILGVSPDTLERRFAGDIKKGRANMRSSLRKRQFELAIAGNVGMLVWLGKNLLGQSEKVQHSGPGEGPIKTAHEEKHVVDYDAIEKELRKLGGRVEDRTPPNGRTQPIPPD